MSALVELKNVTKRYTKEVALHPTNLSAERGKITVLIGPSGCGKSTLLRLIIGLIEPDCGSIDYNSECRGAQAPNWLCDPGRRAVPAPHGQRKCRVDGALRRPIPRANAKQTFGIMRADEIFRKTAHALSPRAFWWPAAARRFDAGVDALAGIAVAGRASRRARSIGASFFTTGFERNLRSFGADSSPCDA